MRVLATVFQLCIVIIHTLLIRALHCEGMRGTSKRKRLFGDEVGALVQIYNGRGDRPGILGWRRSWVRSGLSVCSGKDSPAGRSKAASQGASTRHPAAICAPIRRLEVRLSLMEVFLALTANHVLMLQVAGTILA